MPTALTTLSVAISLIIIVLLATKVPRVKCAIYDAICWVMVLAWIVCSFFVQNVLLMVRPFIWLLTAGGVNFIEEKFVVNKPNLTILGLEFLGILTAYLLITQNSCPILGYLHVAITISAVLYTLWYWFASIVVRAFSPVRIG